MTTGDALSVVEQHVLMQEVCSRDQLAQAEELVCDDTLTNKGEVQ